MKYTLIIILVLITTFGFGQNNKVKTVPTNSKTGKIIDEPGFSPFTTGSIDIQMIKSTWLQVFKSPNKLALQIRERTSDTIELFTPIQYHFIKIVGLNGDTTVYQIVEHIPTIEQIKQSPKWWETSPWQLTPPGISGVPLINQILPITSPGNKILDSILNDSAWKKTFYYTKPANQ